MKTLTTLNRMIAALALSVPLIGCLTAPVESEQASGRVTLEVSTPALKVQNGVVPDLARLEVVMVSSTRDTVRDVITRQGSNLSTEPAYLDGVRGFVHLFARYELKAGRGWTLHVKTYDAADSVIHEEQVSIEGLREYEYRSAQVQMEPRRLGYAVRVALPQSGPSVNGHKKAVEFQRVELVVDGRVVRDSLLSDGGRQGDLVLSVPHMRAGLRTIEFRAYGKLERSPDAKASAHAKSSAVSTLLLSGTAKVLADLSRSAEEQSVALAWSPETGEVDDAGSELKFRVGAVGAVRMNVVVPGAISL